MSKGGKEEGRALRAEVTDPSSGLDGPKSGGGEDPVSAGQMSASGVFPRFIRWQGLVGLSVFSC